MNYANAQTSLSLTATLVGMLSFSLTIAAFAAQAGTWPVICGDSSAYGPNGSSCQPPAGNTDPLWGLHNCLPACYKQCDTNCPNIGGPPNSNSICKDCCSNYNAGNAGPNAPTHCSGASVGDPQPIAKLLRDTTDVLNDTVSK